MHSFSPSDVSDLSRVNPPSRKIILERKDNYSDMCKDMQHIKNRKAVE